MSEARMKDAGQVPADALVELTAELVGEGSLLREIDQALSEAAAALARRKLRGRIDGDCVVTATIRLGYDEEREDHVVVTHFVQLRTPRNEVVTSVVEKRGRLLCQPGGSGPDSPNQMRLFRPDGEPIGTVDRRTGELVDGDRTTDAVTTTVRLRPRR